MKAFIRCPQCNKFHFIRPKTCGCGFDFERAERHMETRCPKCGALLDIDKMIVCPGCKTDLNELIHYTCPKCGKQAGIREKYCECGQELITEMTGCPFCGKGMRKDAAVCPHCGKNRYTHEPEQEYVPDEYHCPRCGCKVPTISSPCPVCDQPSYTYESYEY